MNYLPLPSPPNPIEYSNGKWWFWDEIWANRCGPFDTQKEAEIQLKRYCDGELK